MAWFLMGTSSADQHPAGHGQGAQNDAVHRGLMVNSSSPILQGLSGPGHVQYLQDISMPQTKCNGTGVLDIGWFLWCALLICRRFTIDA